MTIDIKEILLAAHDALHKGDVEGAHEILHRGCGVNNDDETALPIKPLGHLRGFDLGFQTACRKNNVRATYVCIDPHHKGSNGEARLISGGDLELTRFLDGLMRKT